MGYHYAIDSWVACNTPSWFRLPVIILDKMTDENMYNYFISIICRTIDPTKIIVTGKRVRFSFIGISDIIYFDPNQTNQAAAIANYQQVLIISCIWTKINSLHSFNWIQCDFAGGLNVTWEVSISTSLQMSSFGARGTDPVQYFSCVKNLFIRFTKLSSVSIIRITHSQPIE